MPLQKLRISLSVIAIIAMISQSVLAQDNLIRNGRAEIDQTILLPQHVQKQLLEHRKQVQSAVQNPDRRLTMLQPIFKPPVRQVANWTQDGDSPEGGTAEYLTVPQLPAPDSVGSVLTDRVLTDTGSQPESQPYLVYPRNEATQRAPRIPQFNQNKEHYPPTVSSQGFYQAPPAAPQYPQYSNQDYAAVPAAANSMPAPANSLLNIEGKEEQCCNEAMGSLTNTALGRGLLSRPDILDRDHPPGDLYSRTPYQTEQFYYYHRPYNRDQVATSNSLNGLGQTDARPYSNWATDSINNQVQRRVDAAGTSYVEDGYLEFVDWREHRAKRENWERTHPKVFQDILEEKSTQRRPKQFK